MGNSCSEWVLAHCLRPFVLLIEEAWIMTHGADMPDSVNNFPDGHIVAGKPGGFAGP